MTTPLLRLRSHASHASPGTSPRAAAARRARWLPLLLAVALTPVLGGGCVVHYQSSHDDDNNNNGDNGGGTTIIITDTAEGSGGTGDAVVTGAEAGGAQDGTGTPSATPTMLVMLRSLPDADGDGESDLAILVADGAQADLPATAWLLSGADGRVLEQRELGALAPDRLSAEDRLASTPAAARAPRAVPPSATTTSARPARSPARADDPAPRRD